MSDARPAAVPSPAAHATTRRDLLKAACGVAAVGSSFAMTAAAASSGQPATRPATQPTTRYTGSDLIRVGLIGCGGRGLGAVKDAARSAEGVEIRAIGDVFPDQVEKARANLARDRNEAIRAADQLTDETCFSGFDAYRRVIDADVDYVLIACPPYFHPKFAEAAIDAGKHVFCEKPGAIDAPGLRQLLRAGEKATASKLGFLAGTQRRHQLSYLETIRRIHDGAIGRPMYGEAWWNNNEWIAVPRESGWSDVEWQIRNWRQNRWLSGDAPGVLVIHYVDAVSWALGAEPESAFGSGGRSVYTEPELFGNIYDHFEANLTYPGGVRVHAMCRNWPGDARHAENVIGTGGTADLGKTIRGTDGKTYDFRKSYAAGNGGGDEPSPYTLEHRNLIQSVREGRPINEARQLADSTLATMMMREAAYSGRVVTRKFLLNESQRILGPEIPPDELSFGENPIDKVPVPGEYELA